MTGRKRTPVPLGLGLLLMVALLGPTSLPAQTLKSPLVIDAVEFPDGQPIYLVDDPVARDVVVTIKNDGQRTSAGYELSLTWESPSGERIPLSGTELSSTDVGRPLSPGQHREHPVGWNPAEEQIGPGTLRVELVESQVLRESLPVFVAVHDLELSAPRQPVVMGPDATVHIPVTVHNGGNSDETVTWTVTSVPARLQATFLEPVGVFPPGDSDATLAVTYPFVGSVEDAVDLRITVRGATQEQQRFAQTPEIDLLHDDPPAPPGMSLSGPARTVFAQPGETADVRFVLSNTGGEPDTYSFTPVATGGWTAHPARVDGQEVTTLSLAPGASKPVVVPVTPTTDSDRLAGLSLTARSLADVTDTADAVLVLAGVLPVVTGVSFTTDPVYVDDPVRVAVSYENAGNTAMEGATLTVQVDYTVGSTETRTVALDDLLPERGRTAILDLGVAQGAGPVVLSATVAHGPQQATATSTELVRTGTLAVTAPDALPGLPGEQVRYHTLAHAFKVRNTGNHPESVTVTVTGASVVGDDSFTLEAGAERTVAVTQTVPETVGDARTLPVTLTARLDDSPTRSATASVQTPVRDNTPPTLTWVEAPDRMLPSDAAPVRVQVEDDTFLHRAWIDVTPRGDGVGWSLELLEAGDWIALLRSGAPGDYQMTPRAQDVFGNVGSGPTRDLDVSHAPDEPDPEPVTLDADYANGTLTVRTNAPAVRLTVDGNETLHDVTDGELTLALPLTAGSHLIQVAADDAEGGTVWRNTTVEVPATPADAPGLVGRLTPGPGAVAAAALCLTAALLRRRNRGGPYH